MSEQDLILILEESEWTFAKTMPWIPHWYILRKNFNNVFFDKMVEALRAYGIDEIFGKKNPKTYRYFYANGYKYWTMGNPINETTVINKAKINQGTSDD